MIPASRWREKKELRDVGIVAILQDNTILNDVYELVFGSNDIAYKIFGINGNFREIKPRSVLLDFDNLDILNMVVSNISRTDNNPRLVYYGLAPEEIAERLIQDKIEYIRYGDWKGLVEALK